MRGKIDGAPLPAPRFFSRRAAGWTLFELTIVLVVAAGMVFVAVRTFRPAEALALEQAERLRNDLRHAQMLAMTWGQSLRVSTVAAVPGATCPVLPAVPARYEVRCTSGSAVAPCNGANPVIDPATGQAFSVNVECHLDIVGPGFTLDIDSLGRPRNGAALTTANAVFTISGGAGITRTVSVAPITGFGVAQ